MKRLLFFAVFFQNVALIAGCGGGLSEMYSDLYSKVPICVKAGSSAANPDGRGWKNAFPSIETAISSGNVINGSEIWVSGTFNADVLTIAKQISLYGGFSGNESRKEERNLNHKTTIVFTAITQAVTIQARDVILDGFAFKDPVSLRSLD